MHVSGAVAEREGGGVREDDGGVRGLERVHGRLVGGVRQVHDHAQAVQFFYHSLKGGIYSL